MTAKRPIPRIRVTIRLEPEMVARVDRWRGIRSDGCGRDRSVAIVKLLDDALAVEGMFGD